MSGNGQGLFGAAFRAGTEDSALKAIFFDAEHGVWTSGELGMNIRQYPWKYSVQKQEWLSIGKSLW